MKYGDLVSLKSKTWPEAKLWSNDGSAVLGSLKQKDIGIVLRLYKSKRTVLVLTPAGEAGLMMTDLLKVVR